MSLKSFHVVLISLSSLLAFVFGGWSVHGYRAGGGPGQLATGLGSIAVGVALIAYVVWFVRKVRTRDEEERRRRKMIRPLAVLGAAWFTSHRAAEACATCYGDAEGPMIDAARMGVWLLFGLIFAVQLAFVLFFLYLRRQAREHNR